MSRFIHQPCLEFRSRAPTLKLAIPSSLPFFERHAPYWIASLSLQVKVKNECPAPSSTTVGFNELRFVVRDPMPATKIGIRHIHYCCVFMRLDAKCEMRALVDIKYRE
eukprot:FR740150.1.p1 GENE.FR740150.1~~FR740150.1.p1  ORF type:complete len:108 (-),score=6.08 FR740150.1:283-606(-)